MQTARAAAVLPWQPELVVPRDCIAPQQIARQHQRNDNRNLHVYCLVADQKQYGLGKESHASGINYHFDGDKSCALCEMYDAKDLDMLLGV